MDRSAKSRGILIRACPMVLSALLGLLGAHTFAFAKEAGKADLNDIVIIKEKRVDLTKLKGQDFLAQNKNQPGVITTRTGLQYKIIRKGKGASPRAIDTVKCHYKGTFIDGKVFDQSRKGHPLSFKVNQLIKGWVETLVMMKPGGKWMLYIPSELGYGKQGSGSKIGPNTVLTFEIELLEVVRLPVIKSPVDALIGKLKDKRAAVRAAAAGKLGELDPMLAKHKVSVLVLTELLKDKDEAVRKAAQEALKKIQAKR